MKNLITIIRRTLWAIILLLLSACAYDTVIQPKPEVPEEVLFSEHIIPIFDESCNSAGCHDDGGIPPVLTADRAWSNLINFAYVNLQDPPSSLLYTKISDGGSMEQFATDQDRALILAWIEQGALDN